MEPDDLAAGAANEFVSRADGRLRGAAVARAGFGALIGSGWTKPILFIFIAPFMGLFLAILVSVLTSWVVRNFAPAKVDRWFRRLQLFSAAAYSLGHGTNDAQKSMGIITTALVAGGLLKSYTVPFWVIVTCHMAMGCGTMAGGWRVVRTMGQRITKLTPFGGFSAETAGALTLIGTAHFGIPVSTTHTITGAIIGVGASRRLSAVHWGVTHRIVGVWLMTVPGAAAIGSAIYYVMRLFSHT